MAVFILSLSSYYETYHTEKNPCILKNPKPLGAQLLSSSP